MLHYIEARNAWAEYLEGQHEEQALAKLGPSNWDTVPQDVDLLLAEAEAAVRVARLQALIARSSMSGSGGSAPSETQ